MLNDNELCYLIQISQQRVKFIKHRQNANILFIMRPSRRPHYIARCMSLCPSLTVSNLTQESVFILIVFYMCVFYEQINDDDDN